MIIWGSYMFQSSVSKNMEIKKFDIIRKVAVGKVTAYLCLTLIGKEL